MSKKLSRQVGAGLHWFVAWRYLLARPRRLAGPILVVGAMCLWVLGGFGLAASWFPLGDEVLSPFRPLPWWLLVTCGVTTVLALAWPVFVGLRYALYRDFGGVAELLPGLIAGLAALASYAVFDYFHRPFGVAGPAEIERTWLLVGGGALATLLVSAPLLWRWLRREIEAGPRLGRFARGRPGEQLRLTQHLARALPRVRRLCAFVLLGLDIGMIMVLAAAAAWSVPHVVWPAHGLAGGDVLLRAAMGLGSIGVTFGVLGLPLERARRTLWLIALGLWVVALMLVAAATALLGWVAVALGALALILGVLAAALRGARRQLSWGALAAAMLALALLAAVAALYVMALSRVDIPPSTKAASVKLPLAVTIPMLVAIVILPLTVLLLIIRYFFTFFSTVSIGGVAIGSMALVIVLSVMSGFETDLRHKILGSNAHILVTKASDRALICRALPELRWRRCVMDVEAAFTDYRAVGEQVAATRGVVAQSPYLISEVVIAANNAYSNVLIKGVEPETVGTVSELDESAEAPDDLEKLWPLNEDGTVRGRPKPDQVAPGGPIPAPGGDAGVGEPKDFSGGDGGPDLGLPDDEVPLDLSGGADAGAGGDPDEPPRDLDLPDDAVPLDLSGGAVGPPAAGDAGVARTDDDHEIFTLDVPIDDDLDGDVDVTGGGRELTAKIPPRVAILPGVLVGRELVKNINLYDGEEVKVISPLGQDTPLGPVPRTKPFRVAGVFFTGMYEYDLKYVYVEIGSLQNFLDLGDEVTGIEVRVEDPKNTGEVVARLSERLGPEYRVQDWKELNRSLFSALKLEKIAMFLVLGIIILVASFSIVGNLIMVVVEKAREIAVIKTLGASDPGVMKIFITQGFFIGLVGTAVGVSLGLLACWAGMAFGLPLDPDVYYIDKLPIHVDPTSVLAIAAAGVVISVVATLYPAYVAARLRPVHGLRYE